MFYTYGISIATNRITFGGIMQKLIFILGSILCLNLFAQDYQQRTCWDDLLYDDGTSSLNQNIGNTAGLVTSGLALAGSPLAAVSATVMLTAYGIDWVKGGQLNRLMTLIEQSEDKIENPDAKTGRLLRRTVRKINRRIDEPISELEFAQLIDQANKDRSLCQGMEYLTIAKMKRMAKTTDSLAFLDSDANLKTEFEGEDGFYEGEQDSEDFSSASSRN